MEAKEFRENQGFDYDSFTKLTSTGIEPDYEAIEKLMESFHKHKMQEMLEKGKTLDFLREQQRLGNIRLFINDWTFEEKLLTHLKNKL